MVPRTPDGKPDLQGVWANNSVTPMTRPTQWKDKDRITDAEVQELKSIVQKFTDQGGDAIFQSVVQMALDAKEKGKFDQTSYDPTTGNYNQFWMADRDWDNRTSLIIDPPNGQYPPFTPEGMKRAAALAQQSARSESGPAGKADGPEDRPLNERCITYGAPLAFAGYNAYQQIIQSPETVVILQEMIHDARVVPMFLAASPTEARQAAARRLARSLGGRYARRRDDELQHRQSVPRHLAGSEADRALHANQPRLHQLGAHGRRSGHVDQAVDVYDPPETQRRSALRVRVPRGQSLDGRDARRRARQRGERSGGEFENRIAVGLEALGMQR